MMAMMWRTDVAIELEDFGSSGQARALVETTNFHLSMPDRQGQSTMIQSERFYVYEHESEEERLRHLSEQSSH